METQKKKILLVGANGLTGSAFQRLFSAKYDITVLNRDTPAGLSAIQQNDFVAAVYLAQSPEYKSNMFTNDLFEVNVHLLQRVLAAMSDRDMKFIYFSTGSVYNFSQLEEVDESSPVNIASGNAYIASKLIGEELVHSFGKKFAQASIVRPFFIYGNRQKESMLFSVIRNKILNKMEIELASGKGLIFNPVYVDDAAAAISELIEKENNNTVEVLNLFGPEETNLGAVVAALADLLAIEPNIKVTTAPAKRMIANTVMPLSFGKTALQQGLINFLKDE